MTLLTFYDDCEAESALTVQGIKENTNISIHFKVEEKNILPPGRFPDDDQRLLAQQVSGIYHQEKHRLCITFPARID
jgi:hypothetical protein